MKKITIINKHLGIGGIEKDLSNITRSLIDYYNIDLIVSYKIKELSTFPISSKVNISYLVKGFPTDEKIHKYIGRKQYINAIKEYFKNIKLKCLRITRTIKVLKTIDSEYLIITRYLDCIITSLFLKSTKTKTIFIVKKNYSKIKLRFFRNKINKLIVPTLEMKNKYNKLFKGNVEYISSFIDLNTKVKSSLKTKNIISIGNFSKDKNVLQLIDIMKEVNKKDKDINLILIGDGKNKNKIRNKINKYNLTNNIKLTGNLNKLEIEDYMTNSSLYVTSTLKDSFGLTFLEAMSYGLPVVCYKSSNKYVDKNGLLIKNRNRDEFADKIIYLFNNKKELVSYGKASLSRIKEFNLKEVAFKWKNVIKSIK